MKMRKIYFSILAAALALALALPAHAESAPPGQEQTDPQEDAGLPEDGWETPSISEAPEESGDLEEITGEPEEPEGPELPETPQNPEGSENPGNPEDFEGAESPEIPESPEDGEMEEPAAPAWPDAPETGDDPDLPPELDTLPPVLETEAPVIEVTVPETGSVLINPYGLPVMLEGRETTEQIAGSTMLLENRSAVAVEVSASAVGTAFGGVALVPQPPAADAWEKEVFLYAEFQSLAYLDTEPAWMGFYAGGANQLLVMPDGLWQDDLMRLEAAGAPYSWGAVRLFGAAAVYPALPWQDGDGFLVSLAFTFSPVEESVPVDWTPDAPSDTESDDSQTAPLPPDPLPETPAESVPDMFWELGGGGTDDEADGGGEIEDIQSYPQENIIPVN